VPNYQSAAKWLVPNHVGGGQTKEKASSERLACLVDQTLRISNLIEDLLKLDEFAESVHN